MNNDSKRKDEGKRNFGCSLTKRLLGQILIDGEFVSQKNLESALEQQRRTNDLLGEILVRMGVLDPKELNAVLFVQGDFTTQKDSVKAAAGVRQLLGGLLIQTRRITPDQLELALKEQLRTNEKLGKTMVRLGFITEKELDVALAFQQHQENNEFASKSFRLGELLVATNHITRHQLEDALIKQKISKKKIGEVLVDAGYVEPHHIDYSLNLQRKLITAALIAAMALASIENTNVAQASESRAGSNTARITVTATVLARANLKILSQKQELVVTNSDISRGYVDIPNASRLEIKSNSPDGYMIVFEGSYGSVDLFREIHVQGLGRDVLIDVNGGRVMIPSQGLSPVTKDLSYRFVLAENAQPGSYMWPITLSVMPMQ